MFICRCSRVCLVVAINCVVREYEATTKVKKAERRRRNRCLMRAALKRAINSHRSQLGIMVAIRMLTSTSSAAAAASGQFVCRMQKWENEKEEEKGSNDINKKTSGCQSVWGKKRGNKTNRWNHLLGREQKNKK